MGAVRFAGEDVQLGGTTHVLPPLGFLALKELHPKLQHVAVASDGSVSDPIGQSDVLLEMALASLQRNYPEMTQKEFGRMLDVGEFIPLVRAVMRVNKFGAVTEKNGQAAARELTGPTSTAVSSPPSDGAGSTSTNA